MINPDVQIQARESYGMTRLYPANDVARVLLALTGKKTFDVDQLSVLRFLGYSVTVTGDTERATRIQTMLDKTLRGVS